jgi:hypothetical protein
MNPIVMEHACETQQNAQHIVLQWRQLHHNCISICWHVYIHKKHIYLVKEDSCDWNKKNGYALKNINLFECFSNVELHFNSN